MFDEMCQHLGLTVATEKNEGPTHRLVYKGSGIDTEKMEVFVPPERKKEVARLISEVLAAFNPAREQTDTSQHKPGQTRTDSGTGQAASPLAHGQARMRRRALTSLVGKLMYTCRAIPAGKPFCYRFLQLAASPHTWVVLGEEEKKDLQWWMTFLPPWSGTSMLNLSEWVASPDIELKTDASLVGWGAYWEGARTCTRRTKAEREQSQRKKHTSTPWRELDCNRFDRHPQQRIAKEASNGGITAHVACAARVWVGVAVQME
jgi:hypothetical protein